MLRYEISYSKTGHLVSVYPKDRGARPNSQVIGDFPVENPRADFEEYREELSYAIEQAMARVGELDLAPFKVTVQPFDGDEFTAKEATGHQSRPDPKDQVPVSEHTTVAEAAQLESEGKQTKDKAKKSSTKKTK